MNLTIAKSKEPKATDPNDLLNALPKDRNAGDPVLALYPVMSREKYQVAIPPEIDEFDDS